ncbi:MAG: YchF-related putative GTPase [Candidatus Marsarchaeota archaeon]|nr:YchF-related putative GTPase [Candidatus Marsarchaeota archaeon]MCL5106111.1 YchF-related putative GTPase [Candidatus Marsarchaeota archaeon]
MLIGIIGAPNKGKSSLFSALTLNEVKIANYPFTTIDPNKGVAYVTEECAEREIGIKCNARNSLCKNGIRYIPINVIDVAGLVEGANEGKGMGNQFLNDLINCDGFILVVDASGKTDSDGNFTDKNYSPAKDARIIVNEVVKWLGDIIIKHKKSYKGNSDAFYELIAGFGIPKDAANNVIESNSLSRKFDWSNEEAYKFAGTILKISKPIVIAANKCDVKNANIEKNINELKEEFGEANVFECSAAIELALRKAERQGIITYSGNSFDIVNSGISKEQNDALNMMKSFLDSKKSNVQKLINDLAFRILNNIVVYPVEDENKFTDHFGNVLPDAILINDGATAQDLAAKIHTELANRMLYAINARTKIKISKTYTLKDRDIIKIVSAAK